MTKKYVGKNYGKVAGLPSEETVAKSLTVTEKNGLKYQYTEFGNTTIEQNIRTGLGEIETDGNGGAIVPSFGENSLLYIGEFEGDRIRTNCC